MADGITAKLSHNARILSIDGEGKYQSAEIDYIVKFGQVTDSATLEEKAIAAVRELAASKFHGVPLKSISIKERLAPNAFTVTVNYNGDNEDSESGGGSGSDEDESEAEMTFECSAETKHVKVATSQTIIPIDESVKYEDPGNLIGWNQRYGEDCDIEGCDVPTGVAVETWTKQMSYNKITTEKKMRWAQTVGCVNESYWKGWPPHCAMFMGASFSKEADNKHDGHPERVSVSFHFRVGPKVERFEFEGKKVEFEKPPFDYIWPLTQQPKQGELPKTGAVVVSVVTQEANFDLLGI